MIDVLQNPFSITDINVTPPTVGALSQTASSGKSSSRSIKDEYVASTLSSSGTYKAVSIPTGPSAIQEIAPKGVVTDKMREEISSDDSYWTSMVLLSVAYPTCHEIIGQVLHEKGVVSDDGEHLGLEFYANHSLSYAINPDGVFMFNAKDSFIEGFDQDAVEDVCLAIEAALNSSSLNMEENPHLFKKSFIPSDYDQALWGRTLDRSEWSGDREPDFSEFVDVLRSDIFDLFSDMQIVDFSMKIDDQGKLTITGVQTNGPTTSAQALIRINKELTAEIKEKAEYLGLLTLSGHTGIYGDVLAEGTILEPFDDGSKGEIKQFRHEVIITSGSNYTVQKVKD